MNELPVMWTRELLLRAAGFDVVADLRKALDRTRQALDAEGEEGPDHGIRLRAAEQVFDLADVRKRRDDDGSRGPAVVNVAIISSEATRHPAQANGVALRFVGGNGDGA